MECQLILFENTPKADAIPGSAEILRAKDSRRGRHAVRMAGRRFGRLIVLRRASARGQGAHARYECRCDCGAVRIVSGDKLRLGRTKSCGCGGWKVARQTCRVTPKKILTSM